MTFFLLGLVRILLFMYNEKNILGGNRMKRENYISWDEYFMGIAMLAAKRSKDPNTQ